jgi:hypothetical protein
MKLYCFFILFYFFSVSILAQNDISIPSTAIPKAQNKFELKNVPVSPQYSISKPFEPERFKTPSKVYSTPQIEKPMEFKSKSSDLDPGIVYEKKMNKASETAAAETTIPYRGNQFLGEFRTGSDVVGIIYRDFQYVDGDKIRVWVNDKIVIQEITLVSTFQELNLPLQKGFNKVEFEALNQGTSGPNTAEFQVWGEKGVLISSNQWNLATGFKASIVITKE